MAQPVGDCDAKGLLTRTGDESHSTWWAKVAATVHWRDIFTAANFFIISVGAAFAVDIGHQNWGEYSTRSKWGGGLAFLLVYAISAAVGLTWCAALLFAHDGLFRWLRNATVVLAGGVVALSIAAVVPNGLVSTQWTETNFYVKVGVVGFLTVVCQGIGLFSAQRMLADAAAPSDESVAASAAGVPEYEYD